jgi:membrane protease YdiL (CAAX protease family)
LIQLELNRPFIWKLFFIIWIAVVLSTVALIPYALTLQKPILEKTTLPMPLYQIVILQLIGNAIFMGLLVGAGLCLATRTGLGLPFLEAGLKRSPLPDGMRKIITLAVSTGILAALLIIVLDDFIFDPLLNSAGISIPDSIKPEAWKGFLASFYGGITEEVLMRLFLLTLFAWIGRFIVRKSDQRPGLTVLWIANILAAVLFGLGHLPATAALGLPLDTLIVTRALVLNGVAGLAFGWLYWTYGLESAIIAHFSADMVLHVIFALF